jgi:acylphosphatase
MSLSVCIHCVISGLVQGVGFRFHTQKKAAELGISGWVKNRDDGTVEVFAYGEAGQIAVFSDWVKVGPARARVSDIIFNAYPHPNQTFEVL